MVNSLYEYIQPLTVIANQHFICNFDSDALNERWTKSGLFGTSVGAMVDAVDEGFKSAWSVDSVNTTYTFNDFRQYSNTGSVFIAQTKRTTAGQNLVGLTGTDRHNTNYYSYEDSTAVTFKRMVTKNGSCATGTDSSVAVGVNWTTVSAQITSSDASMSISGILELTTTSTLPTTKLQPIFQQVAISSSNVDISMRYFEAYNT